MPGAEDDSFTVVLVAVIAAGLLVGALLARLLRGRSLSREQERAKSKAQKREAQRRAVPGWASKGGAGGAGGSGKEIQVAALYIYPLKSGRALAVDAWPLDGETDELQSAASAPAAASPEPCAAAGPRQPRCPISHTTMAQWPGRCTTAGGW